ncbi:MAG: bleomycin resistance family protein [Acidimicrobiia bacterium]|nr:bleomycin resistance family protein [Acidimicrobiia bacterium]
MPHQLKSLTANLVVSDVARSLVFYRDVLGFSVTATVPPEGGELVFAWVQSGDVSVMLNSRAAAAAEYPAFSDRPVGGTLTLFISVTGIRDAWAALEGRVKVVMPLEVKWYGMTEFAFEDPDGYTITFAERES